MKKLLLLAIAVLGISAVSFGQSKATATSTATLITPISIKKTADLVFGTVASSNTAGTIELKHTGTLATATGGASLVAITATRSVAEFEVTGEGESTISVNCPATLQLNGLVAGNTLTVKEIATDCGISGTLDEGKLTIKVQGTLDIPALSKADVYSNTFDVTVNYN